MEKNNNENQPTIPVIDAEKVSMYQNFANKRSFWTIIVVVVGFIIYASIFVIGYTVREQHWQETSIKLVESFTQTGVSNEILTNTDH